MKTEQITIDRLHANPWNPNKLTAEEFAELVAEVRHLGQLPKPIVVRQHEDGYQIVDGEHNWRAAKEVGLATVTCEVVEVDDFEALRQTLKRNQHGTHDRVLEGKLFERMLKQRDLSIRKLAEEIEVSEGTIRNALLYAELAERFGVKAVEKMPRRHLRMCRDLPTQIGQWWAESGAGPLDLMGETRWPSETMQLWFLQVRIRLFRALEEGGFTKYVTSPETASEFREKLRFLKGMRAWETSYRHEKMPHEQLREYTSLIFEWCRSTCYSYRSASDWMDLILDTETIAFRITPETFHDCLSHEEDGDPSRISDRIRMAIYEATGKLPPDKPLDVAEQLAQIRFDERAPDWLKKSTHSQKIKIELLSLWLETQSEESPAMASWRQANPIIPEKVLREVATWDKMPKAFPPRGTVRQAILAALKERAVKRKRKAWVESETRESLAKQVAERFHRDEKNRAKMASALIGLTKAELAAMVDHFKDHEEMRRREAELCRVIDVAVGA